MAKRLQRSTARPQAAPVEAAAAAGPAPRRKGRVAGTMVTEFSI